jgi:agmatine deiminase
MSTHKKEKVILNAIPRRDGYYMPSEFEPQRATWLGWPSNPGTFRLAPAQLAIATVARVISQYQTVQIVAPSSTWLKATEYFKNDENIFVCEVESNDGWLRDIAPTFLIKKNKNKGVGKGRDLRALGWKFNGWGKPKEIKHELDALVALKISNFLSTQFYKNFDFACEGGSYSVDGQGTLITTEQCLLNKNRNQHLSKRQIQDVLCKYLNVTKVIWLPFGVFMDYDTDGHVDNLCVFADVAKVLLSWPKNCGTDACEDKEQEVVSLAAMKVLESSTDAKGRPFSVVKVPHPPPLIYTQKEIDTLPAVKGSYQRKAGVRMAGSHVNLIITNDVVVVPIFHCESDEEAIKIISNAFPSKKVVGVYAREILMGGGNIHCMSQQEPLSDTKNGYFKKTNKRTLKNKKK